MTHTSHVTALILAAVVMTGGSCTTDSENEAGSTGATNAGGAGGSPAGSSSSTSGSNGGAGGDGGGGGGQTVEVPTGTPECIAALAKQKQSEPVANPPSSITEYEYMGALVYYIPPHCCDAPGILLDAQCNVICQPDGGFTGMGDGKCPDFFTQATMTQIIWEDNR